MTIDQVRLTARALDASALVAVAAGAAVTLSIVGFLDSSAVIPTARVCGGALAAAATMALRDPARDLLAAVPTSARLRLLLRGVVLVPVTLAAATLLGVLVHAWVGGPAVEFAGLESVLALTCVGFAATAACARSNPGVAAEAGAIVALGWSTLPMLIPNWGTELSALWLDHPTFVGAAALALAWRATPD
jgi:hypothetical protein